jgi:DNA-binding PadR family transcriptional regulator
MDISLGLWEIAILALLQERVMHPYEMLRLLRERHKDELLVLKRGSAYHAIRRLLAAGLIESTGSRREGRRPERTTYRIRPEGRRELLRSLREMIAVPRQERSEFMAAISFLVFLTPEDAEARLAERIARLEAEINEMESRMKEALMRIDRIHLVETEYLLATRRAELAWVRGLLGELQSGRLNWDLQEIFLGVRAGRKAATQRARSAGGKGGNNHD